LGKRKAQALTIRDSGLDQPIPSYGETCAKKAQAPLDGIIARSLFEGPVRVAIEQMKMYVCINMMRCKGRKKIPNRQAIRNLFWNIRL